MNGHIGGGLLLERFVERKLCNAVVLVTNTRLVVPKLVGSCV